MDVLFVGLGLLGLILAGGAVWAWGRRKPKSKRLDLAIKDK